jgi:glycerol-3-phosphate dehydrogenase
VIGAGVNGAAVAREAALRGLQTMLVDAVDLSAGTSAASSRMIHGGPRYLEHGEIRLVRESLRERERLLRTAAHLVAPYPLLIPFYRHNRRTPALLRLGMLAYDVLSLDKTTPRHRILSRPAVCDRYPGLDRQELQGAALYFDAQAYFAERLAVEQALDVAAAGGTVLTHVRVTALCADAAGIDVELHDELTDQRWTVRSSAVVNAAGPWVDRVLALDRRSSHAQLIGASKGSHLTVAAFAGAPATGVHYEARSDGRAILVLPQPDGRYLIGQTDIFEEREPGELICSDAEVDYLLGEVNQLIPGAGLTPNEVLHSYAGARPLPYSAHATTPGEVSRDHKVVVHRSSPGLFSITGGKLTTHRALGELAFEHVLDFLTSAGHRPTVPAAKRFGLLSNSPTRGLPLPGARVGSWPSFASHFSQTSELEPAVSRRLLALYGVRATRVCALTREDPRLAEIIPGTSDVLAAEVAVAFRDEFGRTLTDVLARRLMLVRRDDVGLGCAPAVAEVCALVQGWSPERVRQEVSQYRQWAARLRPRALERQIALPSDAAGTVEAEAPAPTASSSYVTTTSKAT